MLAEIPPAATSHRYWVFLFSFVLAICLGNRMSEASPVTLAIKHVTEKDAPNPDSPNTRLDVGVNEKVNLSLTPALEDGPSPVWSIESPANGEGFETKDGIVATVTSEVAIFKAGTSAKEETTIICTVKERPPIKSVVFKTHPPKGEIGVRRPTEDDKFPQKHQGSGMHLDVTVTPNTVSFEGIFIKEVPNKDEEAFTEDFVTLGFTHRPNQEGIALSDTNGWSDHAWGEFFPWISGTATWPIPIEWSLTKEDGWKRITSDGKPEGKNNKYRVMQVHYAGTSLPANEHPKVGAYMVTKFVPIQKVRRDAQ